MIPSQCLSLKGLTILVHLLCSVGIGLAGFELNKSQFQVGESIQASWTDSPGNTLDWVGIYSNPGNGPVDGAFVGASTIWLYTSGTQTAGAEGFVDGSVTFGSPGLEAGNYIAFFLENDGYVSIEDPVPFTIGENNDTPPQWFGETLDLVRAELGQEYRGRLAPYVRGVGTLTFTKVGDGAPWITVESNGNLTGTPAAPNLGSSSFRVRVEDANGMSAEANANVNVTSPGGEPKTELKVMAYNLWVGGKVSKNLEAIIKSGADVIGLQETIGTRAQQHAEALGWHSAQSGGSVGILSKYPIVETLSAGSGIGARIQISADPKQEIVLWSCHLSAFPYGPYDACWDGENVDVLLERETSSGRLPQIQRILEAMEPALDAADTTPVFLVGDFNTPSHLDWTEAAKHLHCDYVVQWPVTMATSAAGLKDAYREVHPDPVANRGDTWSPIYSLRDSVGPEEEPQDRIDMIHFAGKDTSVMNAEVFLLPGELNDVPNHGGNAWPSDHAAVVSSMKVPAPQEPRTGRAFHPSPSSGKRGIDGDSVTLRWRGDIDAESYEIFVGTTSDLGTEDMLAATQETEVSAADLDPGTVHFWRVDSLKEGGTKVLGEIWEFTTAGDLGDSALWKFDEGEGTTVADTGGGGLHGHFFDLDTDAWEDVGFLGQGVALTADNGYIEMGEQPKLRATQDITVAAWVKPGFYGDYAGIASYVFDTGSTESGYSLHTRSGDHFGWGVGSVDRGAILYLTSPQAYDPDEWHFVAGTYDGSEVRLFVNGAMVSSGAMTGPIDWDPLPETGFIVGSYVDNNDDIRFEGQITQVEFWDRALPAEEIRAMFTITGAKVCPSGFACTEDAATGEVTLTWAAPDNVIATGLELLRNGTNIATLPLDATTYTDSPPGALTAASIDFEYTLRLVGEDAAECVPATCTASFFNGTLIDGLVLYLPFNNPDEVADESGNDLGTELLGDPSQVEGAIGSAVEFDDTADPRQYIILEDSEDLQFGDSVDFSVSFWINTNSPLTDNRGNGGTNYDPAIISNKDWNSGLNPGWVISGNSSNAGNGDGHLEWNIGDGSVRADFDTTDALLNDGNWHHVAVTHDRDSLAVFYLDNRKLGEVDISSVGDIDSGFTTNIATDGAEGATWENWFPGAIDDLAIWRRALASNEVSEIYQKGIAGSSFLDDTAPFEIQHVTLDLNTRTLTLTWPNLLGRTFSVEKSDDLRNWTELEDGISSGDQVIVFESDVSQDFNTQFYRVRRQ